MAYFLCHACYLKNNNNNLWYVTQKKINVIMLKITIHMCAFRHTPCVCLIICDFIWVIKPTYFFCLRHFL